MRKWLYSSLFFAGCIASVLFLIYLLSFILYLNHLDQPLPAIAFIPKEIFLFIPFICFYAYFEVLSVNWHLL
ncbi:hypothetical protein J7K91_02010, partial [bacterium]|nr:hypothetical protein [bacterium]